jgi:glycosyltransferase involved in cell wall biosynthesis
MTDQRLTLGAFTVIYNAEKYDIPIVESVESVIDVVDQFVIAECYSQDDTYEICQQLQSKYPSKIKIIRRPWVTHFTELASAFNFAKDHLTTDFVYELQADEAVGDESLEELRLLPGRMMNENKTAARVHFLHFLTVSVTFPFCYESVIRVAKQNTPWNTIGDGVQLAYPDSYIPEIKVLDTNIRVYHYGKALKSPEKGFLKEVSFQELFKDLNFPDPKMKEMSDKIGERCDYLYLFRDHIINNTITRFTGVHPRSIQKRIEKFKDLGYEQFVSEMEVGLNI